SIAPRDTNTIYVPIIVERIKTWAMIDTGATFSCVSPAFCSALGLAPSPPKQGTIRLGHNDSKVLSRLGEIKLHVLHWRAKPYQCFHFLTLAITKWTILA
ncbi:aspartyl protease family protein, partial [Streptomyces sundarbansensis]